MKLNFYEQFVLDWVRKLHREYDWGHPFFVGLDQFELPHVKAKFLVDDNNICLSTCSVLLFP